MTVKRTNLKAASGTGFDFEDQVSAFLMCEMLQGKQSLLPSLGPIEALERQAGDVEPFGDLLLVAPGDNGIKLKCACSVKSNQPVTTNGCKPEMKADLWTLGRSEPELLFGLFTAPLASTPRRYLNLLCQQARSTPPERLDKKIINTGERKVYDSFADTPDLPGKMLARLVHRDFDFQDTVSRDRSAALVDCASLLNPSTSLSTTAESLWKELIDVAKDLRVSGGVVSRLSLVERLRFKFDLRDDPTDEKQWIQLRRSTQEWMDEVKTQLSNGVELAKTEECTVLERLVQEKKSVLVHGASGAGKSAIVKMLARTATSQGSEIVWIKAEHFHAMLGQIPDLMDVLKRSRRADCLLVVDGLDGIVDKDKLVHLARWLGAFRRNQGAPWKVLLTVQTADWSRLSLIFASELSTNYFSLQQWECPELNQKDLDVVCAATPTLNRLRGDIRLQHILATPKLLDVFLLSQLSEQRDIAGEADLAEWWWKDQVRGNRSIAAEEQVAKDLAQHMADDLTSEIAPDVLVHREEATEQLVKRNVLRVTGDGRVRFEHDLFADWSRTQFLRSKGDEAFLFMCNHAQNPPWLRSFRVLAQHLLERQNDLDRWRSMLRRCAEAIENANALLVLDAWLESIVHCRNPYHLLSVLEPDLFANESFALRRLVVHLLHVGTHPDPVVQEHLKASDLETRQFAALHRRIQIPALWRGVIPFLHAHSEKVTDDMSALVPQIAGQCARLYEYVGVPWIAVAELALLNAEKELRREVRSVYRRDGPTGEWGRDTRVNIYAAAIKAASQRPERTIALAKKAAGLAQWDDGDVDTDVESEWLGKWERQGWGGPEVNRPIQSWPNGPTRRQSGDFASAWLQGDVGLVAYNTISH
jgi:hypothetical protein